MTPHSCASSRTGSRESLPVQVRLRPRSEDEVPVQLVAGLVIVKVVGRPLDLPLSVHQTYVRPLNREVVVLFGVDLGQLRGQELLDEVADRGRGRATRRRSSPRRTGSGRGCRQIRLLARYRKRRRRPSGLFSISVHIQTLGWCLIKLLVRHHPGVAAWRDGLGGPQRRLGVLGILVAI